MIDATQAPPAPPPARGRSVAVWAWVVAVLVAVAVLAGVFVVVGVVARHNARNVTFRIAGNEIVESDGTQFVPYGVVLECAGEAHLPVAQLCTGHDINGNSGSAMIEAAAKDWHMNIVRFQVSAQNLFTADGGIDRPYVALIDRLVAQANSLGMVATVTQQEERFNGPAYPTAKSIKFWTFMANHFKNSPRVFFDLYNEPRLSLAAAGGSKRAIWHIWRHGGVAPGQAATAATTGRKQVTYVGMQQLVHVVRATGALNVVIAEGPFADNNLSELPSHVLHGKNIAYGFEPNLTHGHTAADHDRYFGRLSQHYALVPEAFLDNAGTSNCDPMSPVNLPELLDYMKDRNLGFMFWSLVPGAGIVGTDLDRPTSYPAGARSVASASCDGVHTTAGYSASNTVGDGAIIRDFYRAHSVQL